MCRLPRRRAQQIRCVSWSSGLLMLLLVWLGGGAFCVAQDAAAGSVLHLHGSVVNGLTGKPIARALVVSMDQRIATMTDTDGHFAVDVTLTNRPGYRFGPLALTPRKPGYSQMVQPTMVPLDPASAAAELELKLMPVCSITGEVTTSNGEPAVGVFVSLLERMVEEGQKVWRQHNGARTNSRGEFRFSNLEPGEYTVLSTEWRGDQPVVPQQQQRTLITTEYPPDFAGDTGSFDAATKLHLRFGDSPRVDLHLRAARYYPVTIPVAGASAGVSVRVSGGGGSSTGFTGYALGYDNRDHAVEGSLPDGDYMLTLSQRGQPASFAVLPIHVAGAPYQGAPIALAPGASIPVEVEQQFTQAENTPGQGAAISVSSGQRGLQSPVQIYLHPVDMAGEGANSRMGADGEVVLEGVAPGEYTVQASGMRGYVASLTSGGVDLLHHTFVVSPDGRAEPIDVVLRDDAGTVSGDIIVGNDAGALPQTTFLALIPEGGAGIFTQGNVGPDGKFQVGNVAPGSYRILAFRGNFQQIAYRDPKTLEAWNGKGATVTVTAGGTAHVEVPLLDESEAHPE